MRCDENYEKWGGYMLLGVVSPLKFSKIPLSDHGVHLKGLQTPPDIKYMTIIIK